MAEKRSGREIAVENLNRFKVWVEERDTANDWSDYIRAGKLNRSEIATECGFALSVIRQNPNVKEALEELEARLRSTGTLVADNPDPVMSPVGLADATNIAVDRRLSAAKNKAEQQVKALEEQNAALRAEVRELRDRLNTYRHLDEHLCKTGRLLRT